MRSALASALLLIAACSSGVSGPVYPLPALRALLVGAGDVDLAGYTPSTPTGEQQAGVATAIRYFTAASGFRQLTVTLVATRNDAAARAASASALATAVSSLRSTSRSGPVAIGSHGRQLTGRTKGYGALQDSVYFVEGAVAVSVTLSSSTPDQPSGVATGVARSQDAKLRKAA